MTTQVDFHRSDFNTSEEGLNHLPFDGDILWRDAAGDDVIWLMGNNEPFAMATLPFVSPDWHVKATGNFDASFVSPADILWQNDNGALALWQMNGITVSAIHALPNPGPTWHVVGDNDFNQDGADDILFRNDNGSLAIWTGISAATGIVSAIFAGTQNPGPTWHVVGTGDTNADAKAGVLWQNDNGGMAIWENAIGTVAGTFTFTTVAALPAVDSSWHAKGMADLNGDGLADIVFQNDNGAVVVWEMNGTTITGMNLININPGPSWHVVGMRDMNGDNHEDIVFQNDNGAAAVWEDYASAGGGAGVATFLSVLAITPNPNPNGHVWDLL